MPTKNSLATDVRLLIIGSDEAKRNAFESVVKALENDNERKILVQALENEKMQKIDLLLELQTVARALALDTQALENAIEKSQWNSELSEEAESAERAKASAGGTISEQDALALRDKLKNSGYLLEEDEDGAIYIKKEGNNKKPAFFLDFNKGELTAANKKCNVKEYEDFVKAVQATKEVKGSEYPIVLHHPKPKELEKMRKAAGNLGLEEGRDYIIANSREEFEHHRDHPEQRSAATANKIAGGKLADDEGPSSSAVTIRPN